MITDEQVIKALDEFYHTENDEYHSLLISSMKGALKVHEQSKWIEFDANDVSTYPIVPDGYVNVEVNVFDTVNNCVSHDYFHPDYGFNHYQHHVTHWQPLPEFKE